MKTAQTLVVNALPQGFVVGGVGDDLQFSDGRNWLQSRAVTHVDLDTLDVISKPSDGGHVTGLHGYSLHRVRQLFDGVVQRRGVHLIGHERSLQLEPLGAVSRAGGTKIENVTHVTQDPGGSSVTPRAPCGKGNSHKPVRSEPGIQQVWPSGLAALRQADRAVRVGRPLV